MSPFQNFRISSPLQELCYLPPYSFHLPSPPPQTRYGDEGFPVRNSPFVRQEDCPFSPFLPSHGHLSGTHLYTTGGASQSVPSAGYLSPITCSASIPPPPWNTWNAQERGCLQLSEGLKRKSFIFSTIPAIFHPPK